MGKDNNCPTIEGKNQFLIWSRLFHSVSPSSPYLQTSAFPFGLDCHVKRNNICNKSWEIVNISTAPPPLEKFLFMSSSIAKQINSNGKIGYGLEEAIFNQDWSRFFHIFLLYAWNLDDFCTWYGSKSRRFLPGAIIPEFMTPSGDTFHNGLSWLRVLGEEFTKRVRYLKGCGKVRYTVYAMFFVRLFPIHPKVQTSITMTPIVAVVTLLLCKGVYIYICTVC